MVSEPAIMPPPTPATWRRFLARKRGLAGSIILTILIGIAIFAPVIASDQPIVCRHKGTLHFPALVDVLHRLPFASSVIEKSPPFNRADYDPKSNAEQYEFVVWPLIAISPTEITRDALQPPSSQHWLGTDGSGRDIASRMVHGAAVSVQVGIVSMSIAALIGIVVGAVAGYSGGWLDAILSRFIEIVICFPEFFLILCMMVWVQPSIVNVMIIVGLTRWTTIARFTRGEFIKLRSREFVTAAHAIGAGSTRVMFRHLLPNALAPVLVTIVFGVANAILIEAGLSWLGFGVQPPNPSWGGLLRDAYTNIRVAPHMVYPPCVAIFVTVLACNLAGDALREALDARDPTTTRKASEA